MNNPDLTLAAETRSALGVPDPLSSDLEPLYLRRSGTSLLIDFSTGEAAMLHFGADLGPALPDLSLLADAVPHSALDVSGHAGPDPAGVLRLARAARPPRAPERPGVLGPSARCQCAAFGRGAFRR